MNRNLRTQAVSFGLAALITLATLIGVDGLAHSGAQSDTGQWAKAAAAQRA